MSDSDEEQGPALDGWDARAAGWEIQSSRFERSVQAVTLKMIDWVKPVAGSVVGELACGPGGSLPLIAELVGPTGLVLASDLSPEMVEAAKRTCAAAGLSNVEVSEQGLDWLDIPTGELHGLICRYGYMFANDPAAALIEARRVVSPGGRFAMASWAEPDLNPYGRLQMEALASIGLGDIPVGGNPGMFRLSDPDALKEMMFAAGFLDVEVSKVPVAFRFASDEDLFDWVESLSQTVSEGLAAGHRDSREAFQSELSQLVHQYRGSAGEILLPGVSLVGTASA